MITGAPPAARFAIHDVEWMRGVQGDHPDGTRGSDT
ncbi:hypothetical protein SAMN05216199_0393 [Pedococcus cremeus]|uniref:Uncharacterized protein n=1 Tax=Pedococcus cremeus TaxID=587636 RepID=A0A1H9XTP4_9MICO|nr:hypothetical protein SAMN05216199_0393 [Pedococcus cremeus]